MPSSSAGVLLEAPFSVVQAAGSDSGPLRSEIKYALPRADLGKLRSILDVNCRKVAYHNPTSRVVSLYFDDYRLGSCIDNLEGNHERQKLRLRWYDHPFPQGELFFEVKRRRGDATSKERVRLQSHAPLDALSFRRIVRELSRLLPRPHAEALIARPEAIVIVEYERRYFEAVGEPFRITLDSGLVFFSQLGGLRPRRRFPLRAPDLLILEGKSPLGKERRLRELLHPLEPRVTRSSKYIEGCQSLGLIRGSHYSAL